MRRQPGACSIEPLVSHAGVAAYFDQALWRDPARVERVARLLLDERWPWPPRHASCSGIDPAHDRPWTELDREHGVELLARYLVDPTVSALRVRHAAGDADHGHATIDSGRADWNRDAPFDLDMISRIAELPTGKNTASWLALVHDLIVEVAPLNAIVCVWPDHDRTVSDVAQMRIVLDTRDGESELGVVPTAADRTPRRCIGKTYARHPRWGTYLNADHLAAIGGEARVAAEVAPARLDRCGALTYIQLTDTIESAMTAECDERRRRLQALMTPILAPPR
jgi:hypothetical protein